MHLYFKEMVPFYEGHSPQHTEFMDSGPGISLSSTNFLISVNTPIFRDVELIYL
jgi:hypothetical protein